MLAKKSIKGLSHLKVIKAFQKAGWTLKQGANHARLHKEGYSPLTIPRHDPVKEMLLKSQVKQAGLSVDAFLDLL
jgi:hypothetical protein